MHVVAGELLQAYRQKQRQRHDHEYFTVFDVNAASDEDNGLDIPCKGVAQPSVQLLLEGFVVGEHIDGGGRRQETRRGKHALNTDIYATVALT